MQRLFEAFKRAGKELYLVGGAVRDLALGVPMVELDDLDFCTNSRPQETLRILKEAGFTTYDVGIEFGTVGCVLYSETEPGYPKDCQVTTYRSAEYYRRGSRHPVVKYGDTIAQDLRRRDFSINSIAMNEAGEFVDPYDGLGDLERRVLRVVSDPLETLAEDPLRILRIGRFVARLGFDVDPDLKRAADERAEHILDISRERWLQEMNKLLLGSEVEAALEFLAEVRILGVILPELAGLKTLGGPWSDAMRLVSGAPPELSQRWASVLFSVGAFWARERPGPHAAMLVEGIAKRLTFDNALSLEIRTILAQHQTLTASDSDWTDAAVRRMVRELDPFCAQTLRFARHVDQILGSGVRKEWFGDFETRMAELERAGRLRPELPRGIGKTIVETFGLKPGPDVGRRKDFLEFSLLDGLIPEAKDAQFYMDYLNEHFRDDAEE